MILVDANILIYAIDRDSPHHARARRWLEETLSGNTSVGLPWSVILAFIRVTTRAGVVRNPLPPDQAIAFVDSWLGQPHVTAIGPGEPHWRILSTVLRAQGRPAISHRTRISPRWRSSTAAPSSRRTPTSDGSRGSPI